MFGKKKEKELKQLEEDIQRIHNSYLETDQEFKELTKKTQPKESDEKKKEAMDEDGHSEPDIADDLISYLWLRDGKCVWSTKDEDDAVGSLEPVD